MLDQNFVYLGVFISLLGGLSYVLDTIKGKAKPNRVTFLLWSIIPFIAFFAQLSKGVGIQSLYTFIVGLIPLLILLASFSNKKAVWKIGKLDLVCGAFSLLGVFLWYLTQEGNIAIVLSILADFLAALPTIIKSYKFPETENYWAYFTGIISSILTILTITNWNFANFGFSLYLLFMSALLFSLVKFKLGKS